MIGSKVVGGLVGIGILLCVLIFWNQQRGKDELKSTIITSLENPSYSSLLSSPSSSSLLPATPPPPAAPVVATATTSPPTPPAPTHPPLITSGIISDTADGWKQRWKKFQAQHERQKASHDNHGPTFFQRNWEPSVSCEYEERLGNVGDGGKWVCNPSSITRPALVYSFGSQGDFSFETAVSGFFEGKAEIHTFDPAHYQGPNFVKYHAWGLGASGFANYKTLPTIYKELGHEGRRVDIMKIDIEGEECNALVPFLTPEKGWPDIAQIQIELHLAGNFPQCSAQKIHDLFDAFSAQGFQIFHKEANIQFGGGIATEFSLVKVDWPKEATQ